MYNEGISRTGAIIDLGTDMEIVEKRGSFYNFDGSRLAQGRENAKVFLQENPDIADRIEFLVREEAGLPTEGFEPSPSPKEEPAPDKLL